MKRFKTMIAMAVVFVPLLLFSQVAQKPPMGWNSFDSYGVYLYDQVANRLVEKMAEVYKPFGYEYFVIDAGWFGEFELYPGTMIAKEKHAEKVNINEYGILQPSHCYFPNGFRELIDKTHRLGLKFGLHLMRGISREAVRRNTIVKGTNYRAQDIADTTSICTWCLQNWGVNMDKPGAQAYYDSIIEELANWGVDFIKYDDIVPFPKEVEAVSKAIAKCGRPIVLSLSPGGSVDINAIDFFRKGNMLRVTNDVWDVQKDINVCFASWRKWQGKEQPGFWIDMDMIPFGQLQLMSPSPETLAKIVPGKSVAKPESKTSALYAGKGFTRRCALNKNQMFTFITMRALAASPLMIGGDLLTMDDFAIRLLTDKEMIECNQNGVMGHLIYEKDGVEIWNTPKEKSNNGWIGIFNRNQEKNVSLKLTSKEIGLDDKTSYNLYDIWGGKPFSLSLSHEIEPNGVIFIKYF